MMQSPFSVLIVSLCLLLIHPLQGDFGDPPTPRRVVIGSQPSILIAENGKSPWVIVAPKTAGPVAHFAALELQRFLTQSTGAALPIVQQASSDAPGILVGHGADVSTLPRDGFIIEASPSRIIIAGHDDRQYIPLGKRMAWGDYYERATIFAVYDFLERSIGARFVFPGPNGTVIPRHDKLLIPPMDILDRPDNIVRTISWTSGKWPADVPDVEAWRRLNNYRLRMQTDNIPNCHGLGRMAYIERFGKSHPEYFALRANGSRSNSLAESMGGQLCFSSGIREEIYQDAKAWLTGQSARSRNMWHHRFQSFVWDNNAARPGFFNVMPQDGMTPCLCPACKKLATNPHWASDQVWQLTCDIANRLKRENIPGYITQMAYGGHRHLPDFPIPDNVLVMVAPQGPWAAARPGGCQDQLEELRRWQTKLHRKVWLWNYVNKYGGTDIRDIPCSTPVAVGDFYRDVQPMSFGAYMQSSADYAAFQFFNWYVFARVMWNKDTDARKLLHDTYRDLYGKAAPHMANFFLRLEKRWLTDITGQVVMDEQGPRAVPPTDHQLWNQIYNEPEIKLLEQHLRDAALAETSAVASRIRFIRDNYLKIMIDARDRFFTIQRMAAKLKKEIVKIPDGAVQVDGTPSDPVWQQAPILFLGGLLQAKTEVATRVRLLRDSRNLYVSYECEEPRLADCRLTPLPHDEHQIWQYNSVEIFLSPSGKRDDYYQWMVTQLGDFADIHCFLKKKVKRTDFAWESGAVVKTAKQDKSWTLEMAIPLSALGKIDEENIAANFTRSRNFRNGYKGTIYHTWSPFVRSYHDPANFGTLSFHPIPDKDLVFGGDFDLTQFERFFGCFDGQGKAIGGRCWYADAQNALPQHDYISLDSSQFLVGGQSLRMRNPGGKKLRIIQYLPAMRKGHTYRLTYSVKADLVQRNEGEVFIHVNDGANISHPRPVITQSIPWTTYVMTFTSRNDHSPKHPCYLRLFHENARGIVWFDNVSIEDISTEKP